MANDDPSDRRSAYSTEIARPAIGLAPAGSVASERTRPHRREARTL
jgi:hypothetical protein